MIEIGRRITALRVALNLNQKQICEIVGVAQNTWNQWEKGRRTPALDAMMRVYDVYRADLNFIYIGSTSSLPHDLAIGVREQLARTAPPPDEEIIAMLKKRGLKHRKIKDASPDSAKAPKRSEKKIHAV